MPPTVQRWLDSFGVAPGPLPAVVAVGCAHLAWAASGAMRLTGRPDGPPVLAPPRLPALLHEAARVLTMLGADAGRPVRVDPATLLSGRAGARGLSRRGHISAGGATRLLRAREGWCALTLSRPSDLELVPAMLGRVTGGDPWQDLTAAAGAATARDFAARAQLLGIPAAALPSEVPVVDVPWRVTRLAPAAARVSLEGTLVVDLSSLWAGPLCARLLHRAGARVVKVESTRRPDGARTGAPRFYDWLHAGHESVAVDFTTAEGRAALADLVGAADIVIEASRPRALAQLGLAPETLAHRPGKVWISVTGYGRGCPEQVAFGDDAAVAGGLVGWSDGTPVFCADAVADPLTGIVAALAALGSLAAGGGHLIDIAMGDVAAAFAAPAPGNDHGPHRVRCGPGGWFVDCAALGRTQEVLPARPPEATGTAAAMGADTRQVLASFRPKSGRG